LVSQKENKSQLGLEIWKQKIKIIITISITVLVLLSAIIIMGTIILIQYEYQHSLSHTWGALLTPYDGQERSTSSEVINNYKNIHYHIRIINWISIWYPMILNT